MNTGDAFILGIIQGLTEFLPVSSSGHLVIAQSLIPGFPRQALLFDIVLHLGTLLAVVFFLRKDIYGLLKALAPGSWIGSKAAGKGRSGLTADRKTVLHIVAATLVTCAVVYPFRQEVEKLFTSPTFAAFMLVVTGSLLFGAGMAAKKGGGKKSPGLADSIVIGLAQGLAILPGISRSGSTIAFGIFRKLKAETAARFSFLISVPAVIGALTLEARHVSLLSLPDINAYAVGFASAAVTGFFSLKLLFLLIRKWHLNIFAYYCWLLGLSVLVAKALF